MNRPAVPRHRWLLAARPKTLTAALLPVMAATALAVRHDAFVWQPALLCILFAALMQVAANFINDLFDYLRGTDGSDRLGPERACAQGWITPRAMRRGIAVVLTAACVVFAFLYTTMLSYCGMGDLLVWLFFGLVPVTGTYYVQAGSLCPEVWLVAAGCGLVTDTLLVLNNYRDRHTDRRAHKRTLIAVLGGRFGSAFYLWQGIAGYLCIAALALRGVTWAPFAVALYLPFHVSTWRTMVRIRRGRALNSVLALTSRNMVIFALLTVVALLADLYI